MSQLTAELMGRRSSRSEKWPALFSTVADRLVSIYGVPTLGNFRDPVKEIFYIVLSARTNERLYKRAHRQLFAQFPNLESLANANVRHVSQCVAGAGLGRKRARQIVAIAKQILAAMGPRPQREFRKMNPHEAYAFLNGLPGLGPKSALCVMMCSLNHDVFPVDVNVQRVFSRLGAIRSGLKHYQAQAVAPGFVPAGRSKELHVGLMELGRKVCTPHRPKCQVCALRDICRTGIRTANSMNLRRR